MKPLMKPKSCPNPAERRYYERGRRLLSLPVITVEAGFWSGSALFTTSCRALMEKRKEEEEEGLVSVLPLMLAPSGWTLKGAGQEAAPQHE